MGTLRGIVCDLDVLLDDVKLLSLLVNHMGDISKELIELADRLLDVANFRLSFNDQGLLKIDFILRGQPQLVLLLLLAKPISFLGWGRCLVFQSSTGGCCGRLLFLDRLALERLELGQGSFEFSVERCLSELLRRLWLV